MEVHHLSSHNLHKTWKSRKGGFLLLFPAVFAGGKDFIQKKLMKGYRLNPQEPVGACAIALIRKNYHSE